MSPTRCMTPTPIPLTVALATLHRQCLPCSLRTIEGIVKCRLSLDADIWKPDCLTGSYNRIARPDCPTGSHNRIAQSAALRLVHNAELRSAQSPSAARDLHSIRPKYVILFF